MTHHKATAICLGLAFVLGSDATCQSQRLPPSQPSLPGDEVPTEVFEWIDVATSDYEDYEPPLPLGALRRYGTTRYRHPADYGVSKLSFLSDNVTLLEVSRSSESPLFRDTRTGVVVGRIAARSPHARVVGASASADGSYVVIAGQFFNQETNEYRAYLKVWDSRTKEVVGECTWDPQRFAIAEAEPIVSLDGREVAAAGRRGEVFCWTVGDPQPMQVQLADRSIEDISFNEDASMIIARNRNALFAWDRESEAVEVVVDGFNATEATAASTSGRYVAIIDRRAGGIYVYDLDDRRRIHQLRMSETRGGNYSSAKMAFVPGTNTLFVSSEEHKAVVAFDCASGATIGRWEMDRLTRRAFCVSPNGELIAGCVGSGRTLVWRASDLTEVSAAPPGHTGSISTMAFAKSTERLITAGRAGELGFWSDESAKSPIRISPLSRPVRNATITDLAVSPDGNHLVSLGFGAKLTCWNLATGKVRYELPSHGQTGQHGSHAVGFSKDGERFYSFGPDYYLRVWELRTGKALQEFRPFPPGAKVVEQDGEVAVADPFGGMGGRRGGLPPVRDAQFSKDGSKLAFVADKLYLVESETGKMVQVFDSIVAQTGKFSDDLGYFAHGTRGSFSICKLSGIGQTATVEVEARFARPACFSADGRMVAVRHDDGVGQVRKYSLTIYDTETKQVLYRLVGNHFAYSNAAFTPDGKGLIAVQSDATALLIDLALFRVADGQ